MAVHVCDLGLWGRALENLTSRGYWILLKTALVHMILPFVLSEHYLELWSHSSMTPVLWEPSLKNISSVSLDG